MSVFFTDCVVWFNLYPGMYPNLAQDIWKKTMSSFILKLYYSKKIYFVSEANI